MNVKQDESAAVRDVVVVGAGQAGLALSYYLRQKGVDHILLEANDAIGSSWANRWDSLRLFTPRQYSALPGMRFPGDPWGYPGKDEVATYLNTYAAHFDLPVLLGAKVIEIVPQGTTFNVRVATGEHIRTRQVVIASGPFGDPWTPSMAVDLNPRVFQAHANDYRRPEALPPGTVLVVGGGNSGFQIAHELAKAGRVVHLAEGSRLRTVPQRIAGRDLFWWLSASRVIHATVHSRIGRRLRSNEPIIGTSRRQLRRVAVTFRRRVTAVQDDTVTFDGGESLVPDVVIWTTGYRHDDSWVRSPEALDGEGVLVNNDGLTETQRLYTLGRPWQSTRGSALLGYVATDAQRLAQRLVTDSPGQTAPPLIYSGHRR